MKTAKIDRGGEARRAGFGPAHHRLHPGRGTVLRRGRLARHLYAVGITPAKLDQVAALNAAGAEVKVITDDVDRPAPSPRIPARPRP